MSVCLVLIRLETLPESNKLNDFEFFAESRSGLSSNPVPSRYFQSEAEFFSSIAATRGSRQPREYVMETYSPPPFDSRQGSKMRSRTASLAASSVDTTASSINEEAVIQFYFGNPSVEMVKGILHLHRENERTSLNPNVPRSSMLCMLSVPAYMSSRDLLSFIASFSTEIERVKIIRDQIPNQYMVLLKFLTQEKADLFYDHFNGVPFNSIEPGICHLAYVAKIDALEDIEGGGMSISGFTELPPCAICLERIDEAASGVLTILCNHSFHSACIQKWEDSSCPVCRYFQTPQMVEERTCTRCGLFSDDLWLCMLCGHVGCGRYSEKHAVVHYEETNHIFALNVKTQRVWDYASDGYVHRLIQGYGNAGDKIVEYQNGNPGGTGTGDEKMESVTLEYTYLLTSQLESQRHYFEECMEDLRRAKDAEIEELRTKLVKEKASLEKKYHTELAKVEKLRKELESEQLMNANLRNKQKEHVELIVRIRAEKEAALAEKEKELQDLREQLQDILRHLETQEKISALPSDVREEIETGRVQTLTLDRGDLPQPSSSRRSTTRKKNRLQ